MIYGIAYTRIGSSELPKLLHISKPSAAEAVTYVLKILSVKLPTSAENLGVRELLALAEDSEILITVCVIRLEYLVQHSFITADDVLTAYNATSGSSNVYTLSQLPSRVGRFAVHIEQTLIDKLGKELQIANHALVEPANIPKVNVTTVTPTPAL